MANPVKGLFSMFRNPAAHVPRLHRTVTDEELLELLTTLSMVHRRLDSAQINPVTSWRLAQGVGRAHAAFPRPRAPVTGTAPWRTGTHCGCRRRGPGRGLSRGSEGGVRRCCWCCQRARHQRPARTMLPPRRFGSQDAPDTRQGPTAQPGQLAYLNDRVGSAGLFQ
ncbi:TIGR02391 family protein [Actinacidiphila yanglinensis]|uniref:TIGR02391 family protein n=1 Tax=Actinacidiphila yanglinensis TaxID=310779 RepID=UPI0038996A8E